MSDEKKIGRASVSVDEKGQGRVMVGLTDISNSVGAGVVEFRAGQATVIRVELLLADAIARGEIELDEDTAKALEAIGWTGPDTELLRRRDLQDALGGLGVVLREWDALLGWVRTLVEHNRELQRQSAEPGSGLDKLRRVANQVLSHEEFSEGVASDGN